METTEMPMRLASEFMGVLLRFGDSFSKADLKEICTNYIEFIKFESFFRPLTLQYWQIVGNFTKAFDEPCIGGRRQRGRLFQRFLPQFSL